MERRDADVVVVGAGLAGLTTAYRLAAEGVSMAVLEARERVGGRTVNRPIGGGKVVEMGGEWVGDTQDRIYALAGELGIGTFPHHHEGDEIALIGGRRYRYGGEMPRFNPFVLADLAQTVLRLERAAKQVPVEHPWEAERARELDAATLATWLRRVPKTRTVRGMLEVFLGGILAAESANVSLLHALFYIHSATSFEVMASTRGGAQKERILGGSQEISIALAERLGDAIVTGAPVRRIVQTGSSVRVEADGLAASARRAVIAVPPTLAARIDYDPPLPGLRDQLLQRLPQGTMIKVNVIYDEPFWRNDGLSGMAWSPDLPVLGILDNCPPDGSPGALAGFIKGDAARALSREEPEARRKMVLDCLATYFGPQAGAPADYFELDWSAEPWTRGCFGAYFPPGIWTQYGPILREPIGRIHWAGTETSPVWNGYMDGAVRSGERAAREILALDRAL